MNTHSADALRLEGVTKTYGSAKAPLNALDGVDLTVPSGQLFGLIGHNGAGKSTLFKLVLGLIRPSRGQIRISGSLVNGPDFRAVRRTLGYLPENVVLYDNLSGLETLRFFARLKGAPERQCGELLDRVGLGQAGQRAVREYSKGMRQRLGFAQALLGEPRLLLLDEPTTGLDPSAIRAFYEQLDALREQGVTLVISSHILAELQQRVDALAMLSNGRVCAQGSVQSLRERSRMPLNFVLTGSPGQLHALDQCRPDALAGAALDWQPVTADQRVLRCDRAHKMAVLHWLGQAGLADLQVQEPSLEDVYFGLKEAA